ncbi:MAG: AtpZ/AtpI family protein [Proteobacteria bacterium]|nr:AtpZ/AtpI family protein [Pseudomonadota bacterium]
MDDRDQRRSLKDAKSRIDEVKKSRSDATKPREASAHSVGIRVGIDLLVGVAFGIGLGLLLDMWLGTKPWLMIVFMFLGTIAGIRNVIRTAKLENKKARDQQDRPE